MLSERPPRLLSCRSKTKNKTLRTKSQISKTKNQTFHTQNQISRTQNQISRQCQDSKRNRASAVPLGAQWHKSKASSCSDTCCEDVARRIGDGKTRWSCRSSSKDHEMLENDKSWGSKTFSCMLVTQKGDKFTSSQGLRIRGAADEIGE